MRVGKHTFKIQGRPSVMEFVDRDCQGSFWRITIQLDRHRKLSIEEVGVFRNIRARIKAEKKLNQYLLKGL